MFDRVLERFGFLGRGKEDLADSFYLVTSKPVFIRIFMVSVYGGVVNSYCSEGVVMAARTRGWWYGSFFLNGWFLSSRYIHNFFLRIFSERYICVTVGAVRTMGFLFVGICDIFSRSVVLSVYWLSSVSYCFFTVVWSVARLFT